MHFTYDVSVILVNYNGKKYIDALFESLVKMEKGDIKTEIVFVDNASSDGSVEYLRQKNYEGIDINIVETGANLGFAGGNNAGIAAAGGEYVVLLNNDTAVDRSWLTELYGFMKANPDCGMANSKLLFFYDFITFTFETKDKILLGKEILINGKPYTLDNKFCKNLLYEENRLVCFGHSEISVPLTCGLDVSCDYTYELEVLSAAEGSKIKACGTVTDIEGFENKKAVFTVSAADIERESYSLIQNAGSGINQNYDGFDRGFCEKNSEEYEKVCELTNGCGASIMMKKEDFDAVGGFDERFFMYYEDTDLSLRIRKLGKKILFCPTSIVRHIHTGSSKEWSPFFTYHVYRNKLLMIGKNISKFKFFKYYIKQMREAVREHNRYKLDGTKDSFKLLRGKKNVSFKN